jgi:cytochrome c
MIGFKASVSALALFTLAACSGGGKESEGTETETASATKEEAPEATPAATDVATLDGVQFASLTANADAGKTIFAQCKACHVTDAGVNKSGPSLNALIGRKAGTVPGYNYSEANKNTEIIWTKEKLFQYLEKPQRVMPKTKMVFAGISDAQKRADLIAYLENPS